MKKMRLTESFPDYDPVGEEDPRQVRESIQKLEAMKRATQQRLQDIGRNLDRLYKLQRELDDKEASAFDGPGDPYSDDEW